MSNNNVPNDNSERLNVTEKSEFEKIRTKIRAFIDENKVYVDNNIGVEVDGTKIPIFKAAKTIKQETAEELVLRTCLLLEEILIEKKSSLSLTEMFTLLRKEINKPLFHSLKKSEVEDLFDFETILEKGILIWAQQDEKLVKIIDREMIKKLFNSKFVRDAFHVVDELIEKNLKRIRVFEVDMKMLGNTPLRIMCTKLLRSSFFISKIILNKFRKIL